MAIRAAHADRSVGELLGWATGEDPAETDSLEVRVRALASIWPILLLAILPPVYLLHSTGASSGNLWATTLGLVLPALLGTALPFVPPVARIAPQLRSKINSVFAFVLGLSFAQAVRLLASMEGMSGGNLAIVAATFATLVTFSRMPGTLICFAAGLVLLGPPAGSGTIAWTLPYIMLASIAFIALRLARDEFSTIQVSVSSSQDGERAGRMLDELEEHSLNWFWETDRQGLITYISAKVASWLGVSADELIGKPLTSIANETAIAEASKIGERSLNFYLSSRTAFGELPIPAAMKSEERWWSVSGRPVIDHLGQFRGFIGTGTELTEQRRSEAEAVRLARFDSLTGLANRAEIGIVLDRALRSARPGEARSTSLMLIDLDRFKAVNDTLGHPAGDELLKQVSARLSKIVDTRGQIGRLGGDEFKVVLPGISDPKQLAAIADALITSASKPYLINGANVSIGASVGIAIAPEHGHTSEELVRNSDLALYAAKGAGRGVHAFYEATMHSVAEQRHQIENDMRAALERGEFRIVYQPVVALAHEKIVGFEALIRWEHPTRGAVSPAEFIPIAEDNGMIDAIGEWALRTAAAEAATWAVPARVAVNVSTIQFNNPNFPGIVANTLAQTGLDSDRLELEITESVFVSDSDATDRQFAMLKKLGVRLALDDFGTGYSSLGYLKRAPFDKIKIDQSFVRGASLGQNKNAAIIKAIVTLAETMGLETTAEGVETQDEIDFIRELGCSHIQGFVFGKPLEASAVAERLGERGAEAERVGHKSTREARLRVFRVAHLNVSGRDYPARIRNISSGGAMLEGPNWITEGAQVSVDIADNATVSARVQWVDEGRLGIQFESPVDLPKIMAQASRAVRF